jgi:hypothetical protein
MIMKTANNIALAAIVFTIIGFVASFFVPLPSSWTENSMSFYWTLADSVLYTLLHIGGAVLFLVGMNAYKTKLREAYTVIAVGIVLVGAGLAQVVLLNIFNLIQTPWVQDGGVMLPFLVAGLAIYFGTRAMAKLVGVTSYLTKLYVVFPLVAVGIAVATILPHGKSPLPETFFDISNTISVWDLILYSSSLGMALQIRRHVGSHYTKAMAWFSMGLMGSVVITSFVLIATFITGAGPYGPLLDIIVILGGCLYLKAGHSFAQTKEL